MERKAKCSTDEKVKAGNDYLNGIRSISEIMNDLSIKSTRSVVNYPSPKGNGLVTAQ